MNIQPPPHYFNHSEPNINHKNDSIAIVGIGCKYPGAKNPQQLWENIITRRRQFRRMPDVRLPLDEYQDADKSVTDKTYGTQAAVIDGYSFDWRKHRIPKQTAESTDIAHWLTLDVVLQMLDDAGYSPDDLPRSRTQVIIGNTLTGEFTRSNTLRLRWPFIEKLLHTNGEKLGIPKDELTLLSAMVERQFKSISPEINEDSLAGALSNTIAGRICNYLNLNGGGYTVDGACSSSLISVYTAATHLANGSIDFAIAGGVDISLDPFELIGFAKTGALTQTEMMVYDKRGNGFIPGEGCGIVGMKRLEDARRDGDKVYAVLDGWGMSSDGKGGITAPSVNGQSTALCRAYEKAGVTANDIDFIEGHGTATKVGDRTELLGIAKALKESGGDDINGRFCGVTSFKSIVGHTKAAAGIGAFIKTVLSVNQRVIPPTAGCANPNDVFNKDSDCLYPILRGKVYTTDKSIRAGVSAMGFGGINLHVTLTSGDEKIASFAPKIGERAAMVSNQDSELFCFGANNIQELSITAQQLQKEAVDISLAELTDLAVFTNLQSNPKAYLKVAIIARSPKDLAQKLSALLQSLQTPTELSKLTAQSDRGFLLSVDKNNCKLGWVFPGQGSQRPNMARVLVERFDWARELVKQADTWAEELGTSGLANTIFSISDKTITPEECQSANEALRQTQLAQPAIALTSLLWMTYLGRIGLNAEVVMGHSLGELTAFYAGGAFDEKTLIQLATLRGQLMTADAGTTKGTMLGLACDAQQAKAMIDSIGHNGTLVVANLNSAKETIVSGDTVSIDALEQVAQTKNIRAKQLKVSNAFHSPLVADAAEKIRNYSVLNRSIPLLTRTVISSCDGEFVKNNTHLAEYFSNQITNQVDFITASKKLEQHCDLIFEVGPGAVLSKLIGENTRQLSIQSVESQIESSYDFNQLMGLAFIHGEAMQWEAVYDHRSVSEFVPPKQREFLVNPCERSIETEVQDVDADWLSKIISKSVDTKDTHEIPLQDTLLNSEIPDELPMNNQEHKSLNDIPNEYEAQVVSIVADFTGFDRGSITLNDNLLDDLNLDSIKAAELTGRIATTFDASEKIDPADYATATLKQIMTDLNVVHDVAETISSDEQLFVKDTFAVELNNHEPITLKSDTEQLIHESPIQEVASMSELVINSQSTSLANTLIKSDEYEMQVISIVAEFTGFDRGSITLNDNLLDDLNLDSIKAAELTGRIAATFDASDKIDPADYATATLKQIITDLNILHNASDSITLNSTTTELTNSTSIETAFLPEVVQDTLSKTHQIQNPLGNISSEYEEQVISMVADFTGFDHGSITLDDNLLDDLNLDSIKAAELTGRIAAKFDASDKLDPADYATATLKNIITDLGLQSSSTDKMAPNLISAPVTEDIPAVEIVTDNTMTPSALEHKIQSFYMQAVRSDLSMANTSLSNVNGCHFTIQHFDNIELANNLSLKLQAHGAKTQLINGQHQFDEHKTDGLILILPMESEVTCFDYSIMQKCVNRLHSAAQLVVKQKPQFGITFVQFGGVISSDELAKGNIETASTSSFAATLHLENKNLKVQVTDFVSNVDTEFAASKIFDEINHKQRYCYSHYSNEKVRYVYMPTLNDSNHKELRKINWDHDDVILVTGGGKGITAECAFAFAQLHRTRMILVGSSTLQQANDEVNQTLKRYQQAGLTAHYIQCNLVDLHDVKRLIQQIEASFGVVTGVIHGAGLNKAKRFEQTILSDVLNEVSPKLLGISNICNELAHRPPKMIVGFSSIIGVTGMPGNAWYAFSNETLNLILQRFSVSHPQTQVVALAYSVWGEVGMGARMGSVKRLANMGISAIPSKEGVEYFLDFMAQQTPRCEMVITGSLGGLDIWQVEKPKLPAANRFLQNVVSYKPNIEVIAKTTLSLQDDLYLQDHNYRGTYLFPTVFGLEAMGQTVAYLLGLPELPALHIEDINLSRPIAVGNEINKNATTVIQIKAKVISQNSVNEPTSIQVGISTEQSGFTRDHFAAKFTLRALKIPSQDILNTLPSKPADIEPISELYGGLLFQGPLFQRMKTVWKMGKEGSLTSISRNKNAQYFSDDFSNHLILGDPSFRDSLLQSAQLSAVDIFLPISIKSIDWFNTDADTENSVLVKNTIVSLTTETMRSDVLAISGDTGDVVERLTGCELKRMIKNEDSITLDDWISPGNRDAVVLQQKLSEISSLFNVSTPDCHLTYSPDLHKMKRQQRYIEERPILKAITQKAYTNVIGHIKSDVDIQWNEDGKPLVFEANELAPVQVSLSHDHRHCLYVAGKGSQGCDIEPITIRSKEAWENIYTKKQSSAVQKLVEAGDSFDLSRTRLWCALESIKKTKANINDINLQEVKKIDQAALLTFVVNDTQMTVLTFPITFTRPLDKMVALVIASSTVKEKVVPNDTLTNIEALESQIYSNIRRDDTAPMLCYRFLVGFKDVTTAINTVNFNTYANWMGAVRERALATIAEEMVADFVSGQWGMVTNHSYINVVEPLRCMELVEARIQMKKVYGKYDSSVDMQFDWVKISPDGSEQLVARSYMAATWVEIIGHGQVAVRPFPDYMKQLVTDYSPEIEDVVHEPAISFADCLYAAPNTSKIVQPLSVKQFETTSAESNLVGNIYYANYYHWQSRVMDKFFYDLQKQAKKSDVVNGVFQSVHCHISHLRESMPYDTIEVVLSIKAIYRTGIIFRSEFYVVSDSGQKIKLSFSDNYTAWQSADDMSNKNTEIPNALLKLLLNIVRKDNASQTFSTVEKNVIHPSAVN